MSMHLEPSELTYLFEENDCENANTLAHVGIRMMVLTHFKKGGGI